VFLARHIQQVRQSKLARNAGWMLVGQGFKLAVQAVYFIVIVRSLGVQNYGAFVGVVGLVGIFAPFGSLGSGYLLIKNVARDRTRFRENWGAALLTTLLSSSLLFGIVLLLSLFLLPSTIPLRMVMLVAGSDLFGTSVTGICGQAFIAFERMRWTAAFNVMQSASRMAAAIGLATLQRHASALQWGSFYLLSTMVVAVIAVFAVLVKLGSPKFESARTLAEVGEGLYFSINQSAETVYNDIDKTMLARLGTLEATGIYGAAYRLIDVGFAPVWSLLAAAYPNFFRVGTEGISATLRYAKPLLFRAMAYATFLGFIAVACAGIVPRVLGGEYQRSEEALRWLAVLPLCRTIHFFLSDALSGAGYQGLRTAIHVGVAIFNVLINLWIIPAYSWRGAAWSSIASDALLALAVATAVLLALRRSRTSPVGTKALEVGAEA
jgi:O-antigen/teichoic acid export membrane protein